MRISKSFLKKIIGIKAAKDGLQPKIVGWATGSFGIRIVAAGLSLIISILLSRILGQKDFGLFAYATAWSGLLSIPATLGLDQLLLREIAIYKAHSQWSLIRGILRFSNLLVLVVSLSLVLLALVVAWIINKDIQTNQALLAISLAIIIVPFEALRNLRIAAMQGFDKIMLGQIPEALLAPMLFIISSYILSLFFKEKLNVFWILGLNIITTGISFYVGAKLLQKHLPDNVLKVQPEYQIKTWLSSSTSLMLYYILFVINSRLDILILGMMRSPEEVALFSIASRGSQLLAFPLLAINKALAPSIASLYSQGNKDVLQKIVTQTTRIAAMFAIPMGCIFIFFGQYFLLLFGSEFQAARAALAILSIGQIVNTCTGSVTLLLNMSGHQKYTVVISFSSVIISLILNVVLIPYWGVTGASIATSMGIIYFNIATVILVKQKLGIKSSIFS